jgi:glycosyltransferase involved in cell wall biosynthesis
MPTAGSADPRLTVIVPAWNAEASIETAVRSVLDQRDVDLECIVVDDASTDGTMAVLGRLAAGDPRLVVVSQDANAGASAARNRALEVARGEWLGFLDADDRLLPGGLGALVRRGDATDALAVVGQRISTDGVRTWFPKLYDLPDIREPGRKSLLTHPDLLYYVGPAGKLFRRSMTDGLWFEGRVIGDQPWVVRALVRAGDRIEVIDDLVYEWRRPHPDHYVATLTSARERSAARAVEAVRMAGVAWDVASRAFTEAYDPADARRMEAHYLRRLLRADLGAQLHRATERNDPDLPQLLQALGGLLRHVPDAAVVGAEDAVRGELIDPVAGRLHDLATPSRRAYLDLVLATARIDRSLIRSIGARSKRWPLRLAVRVPVVGRPLAIAALDTWGALRGIVHSRHGKAPRPGPP